MLNDFVNEMDEEEGEWSLGTARRARLNSRAHQRVEICPLPFEPIIVAPGRTADVSAHPQFPVKPFLFAVVSGVELSIMEICIGNMSVFAGYGPYPARLFSVEHLRWPSLEAWQSMTEAQREEFREMCGMPLEIGMPVCDVGSRIRVTVRNDTEEEHRFHPGMLVKAIKG